MLLAFRWSAKQTEETAVERIGFVGLGHMGAAMAWNIHRAGYELGVYNRSPDKAEPFREAGVPVYDAPADLARDSDIVIVMVADPAALHEVVSGRNGLSSGLQSNALLVNMSTVSREAVLATQAAVCEAGGRFLDAPVSGTVKPAEDGTLLILAGGDGEDLERARPLLEAMGKGVVHCGGVGQGTAMKLVLNLMLGGMMQCLAEALVLGRSLELDGGQVLEAIGTGPMGAPLFQMKGGAIRDGRFAKQFPVDLMFKDLNLVLEAAGNARVPLALTGAVREAYSAARARGHGDEDMAAVIRVLEALTGLEVRG